MTCPSSQTNNDLGCGVLRCCDDVSCVVDVSGPCVCATYYESIEDGVFNYSFIANCDYNSVTGTPLGTGCVTIFGPLTQEPYSCYCRPRTSGDIGSLGDQEEGNSIFPWSGGCGYFGDSSAGDTSTATATTAGTGTPTDTPASSTGSASNLATQRVEFGSPFELCILYLFLVAVLRRAW
jgi:hypothetical protein